MSRNTQAIQTCWDIPGPVCPCSMSCASPVRRSQNRTLRSCEPDTTQWLSCDTAMEETLSYIHSHEYHCLKKVKLNKAISTQRVRMTSPNSEQREKRKCRRTRTLCPKNSTVHTHRPSFSPLFSATESVCSTPTSYACLCTPLCAVLNNGPKFQCISIPSALLLTSPLPSGVNAMLVTLAMCPTRHSTSCPTWTSHRHTMLSE
jgi:hypothetical protein